MNEYTKQAEGFLSDTATTIEIVEAIPQKKPFWSKDDNHGINYSVTLKNKNGTYTFDFWDSIKNREIIQAIDNIKGSSWDSDRVRAEKLLENNGIIWRTFQYSKDKKEEAKKKYQPGAYEILSCLSPLYEDNFNDFCNSYDYDSDSITALKTFEACKEQDRNVRKLFTHAELEALNDIN